MTTTTNTRRRFLGRSTAVAGWLATIAAWPRAALAAWDAAAFEAKSLPEVMRSLGAQAPSESREVVLTAPDVAENGAAVPIGVSTTLAGTRRLVLVVEKNPNVVSAIFEVNEHVDANFSTRVKMAQSSHVYAIAIAADGRASFAKKDVRVTLGGCGA